ncbi:hypothetical protein LCGC14_2288750, partial [marine sediment metagenome]
MARQEAEGIKFVSVNMKEYFVTEKSLENMETNMAKQKIEVDIVTTTKIQAIISGKKRTLRMWRLPIPVPIIMRKHL